MMAFCSSICVIQVSDKELGRLEVFISRSPVVNGIRSLAPDAQHDTLEQIYVGSGFLLRGRPRDDRERDILQYCVYIGGHIHVDVNV